MRAAVFVAPRQIELREFPTPTAEGGRIVVRMRAAALCTMEQRVYLGTQQLQLPWVGGHEMAGVVEDVGDARTIFKVGQRVAIGPSSCGQCEYCRRGQSARCLTGFTRTSYQGVPGGWGLTEFRLCSPASLYPLADSVTFDEAALSEPLSCAVHSIRSAEIELGADVVVVGAGPMGLLNAIVAKRRGARVIVLELDKARRRKAEAIGADLIIDPRAEDSRAIVNGATDGRGADVVIAAVGSGAVNRQALELVAKTGTVVLFAAAYPAEPLQVDPNLVHKSELRIIGVEGKTVEDFKIAVKLLNEGLVDVSPLIESRFGLDDVTGALEAAIRPDTYRVIVNP